LLLAFPVTVFADSLYFEMVDGNDSIIMELKENGDFKAKELYEQKSSSMNITINEESSEKVINYFKEIINEDDEIKYNKKNTLSDFQENDEEITDGYLLKICEKEDCKAYQSEDSIITIEEIENGELSTILKEEFKGLLKSIMGPMALLIIIPFIIFVIIFITVIIIIIKFAKSFGKNIRIEKKSIKNTDEHPNNIIETKTTTFKYEKKQNKNNKSPFDID
jgi:hypothetical protein